MLWSVSPADACGRWLRPASAHPDADTRAEDVPMTEAALLSLLVIAHTPDKVLVDLKIVTDDTIVEVYVPGAEGILFVFR